MEIKNSELIGRFKGLFSTKRNIALIHDNDGDGLCSSAIIYKSLIKMKQKPRLTKVGLIRGVHEVKSILPNEFISELREKKIDLVIISDIMFENFKDDIDRITEFAQILIS